MLTQVNVSESDGSAVLMVQANKDIDVPVTVRLTTTDLTAMGE